MSLSQALNQFAQNLGRYHIKYDSFICQLHTLHNIFQQRMETYKRTHLMPPLIAYKAGVSRHNNITADKTTPRS